MSTGIPSLTDAGSTVWLDSVDPDELNDNVAWGVSGATSNPIIVAGLVSSGRFDDAFTRFMEQDLDDDELAWAMTDHLVKNAQDRLHDAWKRSGGDTGWVSFELDPLIDADDSPLDHPQRVDEYVRLGKHWAQGHDNRMIKVPATPAGLDAIEPLCAAGVTLNVTLVFTQRQYELARDAMWRGAQRRDSLDHFKSGYSIFVSRVDVYTHKHVPSLSPDAQGLVGIANAKRIRQRNRDYWADRNCPLKQEMIFASTGAKLEGDAFDKYVAEFAGSDIMTNPPDTNRRVHESGKTYPRRIDELPPDAVLNEIDDKVDLQKLEDTLMQEGLAKFADPHRELIDSIKSRRAELSSA